MIFNSKTFKNFDTSRVPSPCFVVDEVAIEHNLQILDTVQQRSNAKVLLALKAFSMFSLAPLISRYLAGTCASGLHETRLSAEEFEGEIHTYSAAYKEADLKQILPLANHVIFNSFNQWYRFQPLIQDALNLRPNLKFGLRINPLHSETKIKLYDPCTEGSRLGIPRQAFSNECLDGLSGFHFHTLCQHGYQPLQRTLHAVEKQFAPFLPKMQWLNLGGGHHITRSDYDIDSLVQLIQQFQDKYGLQIYLEPGETTVINSGVLVGEVLDVVHGKINHAIMDVSATCHMPDTLEMPYQANIFNACTKNTKTHAYRLGGPTCLAGDIIGDYSFDQPLTAGQRLIFDDMSHYTMVKTTTFNGIALPAIALWNSRTDELRLIRQFDYQDFKHRLS